MTEPVTQPARGRFWLGPVDRTLDASRCPLGTLGCTIDNVQGTCAEASEKKVRRWCPGYAAWVCAAAYTAWDQRGRPELAPEALHARLGARPTSPPLEPAAAPALPRVFADAPATLDGWTIYAPHQPNGRGGFHDDEQRGMRGVCAGWDQDWRHAALSMPWLVLLGPPGTGKTFLCRILARRAFEAGLRVEWIVWSELVDRVKASYGDHAGESESEVYAPLERADLLVVDDVRPCYDTQHDENIAHRLVSKRYGEDRGEPARLTFFTANLTLTELERVIGAAALSRLRGLGLLWACDWPAHASRQGAR